MYPLLCKVALSVKGITWSSERRILVVISSLAFGRTGEGHFALSTASCSHQGSSIAWMFCTALLENKPNQIAGSGLVVD